MMLCPNGIKHFWHVRMKLHRGYGENY